MMMLTCIKQHISNIWSSAHRKISNTEAEFKKKTLLIKTLLIKVKVHTFKNIVDSLYLEYLLSRKSVYPKLLPWSLDHFHQIQLNFISLSRTSLSRTPLYLKENFRSRCKYYLPISNILLACSVIQVSCRVIYKNTIESL